MRGGENVDAIIVTGASAEEISALVLAAQGWRSPMNELISISSRDGATEEVRDQLAEHIRSILLPTSLAENQSQRPDSTGRTLYQGEGPNPQKSGL